MPPHSWLLRASPAILCCALLLVPPPAAAQTVTARSAASSPAIDPYTSSSAAPAPAAPPSADPAPQQGSPVEPYPTNRYLAPWSRVGIGGDISPLGIGLKAAVNVNTYVDARLNGDYFNVNIGRMEVDGFNVTGNIHLDSAAAMLDFYPWRSVWRLSAGLMFLNGNQISAASRIAGGTSFTLDGQTFYSAMPNAATGATPVTGSGVFGLHARTPALVLTGGFGNFVLHNSYSHWSFPAEFGVILTGAPTIDVNVSGWVCTNSSETQCSNLSDAANPVSVQFNNALNAQLSKWRSAVSVVPVYPVFSYSVVYSFGR